MVHSDPALTSSPCNSRILQPCVGSHLSGPMAFMDGVTGRIGWLLPRCALAMTGFEYFMRQFEEREKNSIA